MPIHPEPWAQLIREESDEERAERLVIEDPFRAAPHLASLMDRAAHGDGMAACTLYSFGSYCDEHGPWPVIASFEQADDDASAPKNWTSEQRQGWMQLAARSGYVIPAFHVLGLADKLPDPDELRAELIGSALQGLEVAAGRGSLEALTSLADGFHSGRFGRDPARAFAYFQVAAAADSEGAPYWGKQAEEIRPHLSNTDLLRARNLQQELAQAVRHHRLQRRCCFASSSAA